MRHSLNTTSLFDLTGRVAVVTGGAGMLGQEHARAVAGAGGIPVLVDIAGDSAAQIAATISKEYGVPTWSSRVDITKQEEVHTLLATLVERFGRIDILINNAANNPKVSPVGQLDQERFEHFPPTLWDEDLAVGLKGAFLCSQVLGGEMARRRSGVIVNVASDLALIGPDQRIYRKENTPDVQQPTKPVTYSIVKSGLIGLTRYLATYWADAGVRVNAISPGGVYDGQSSEFVTKLTNLIPLGRMAERDEYRGAILFLISDASSYMTGANLVIDGGRTCW